jgi:hypothetical protein
MATIDFTATEFNKVKQGLASLRQAFAFAQIQPAILELATPDDGARLLRMLDIEHQLYVEPGMTQKGEYRNQVEIMGVIVRWPTKRLAMPSGGWKEVP